MERSIRYTVTEDDCVNALRLHWRPSRAMFSLQLFLGTFVVLMVFFGPSETTRYLALACAITFVLTRRILGPWIQRNNYRRSPIMHDPLTLSFDDDAVHLQGESGESNLNWNRILKWKDSDEYLLLYIAPRQYYIIPKRLRDEGFDVDALCELISARVAD